MEVITALVLMLLHQVGLRAVGARNIPVHKNAPSGPPLELDNLRSNTNTSLATIFSTGELVESVVNEENHGLHLNKNTDEDKIVKNHVYNVVSLDTDDNGSMDNRERSNAIQEEKMYSELGPVELMELHNNENTEKQLLDDRVAIGGDGCPKGTYRVGKDCVPEDIDR